MARMKPETKAIYPVRDLSEANAALAEMASLKRELEAINASMNVRIDQAKADAEVMAAPVQTRMKATENGLLAYAEMNKDALFGKRRSVKLDFGSIGYRLSNEIRPKPKQTLATILERVKSLGFLEAVRTKESLDKDVLRQWPSERLDLVGARMEEKDTFWIEIDEAKVAGKDL